MWFFLMTVIRGSLDNVVSGHLKTSTNYLYFYLHGDKNN